MGFSNVRVAAEAAGRRVRGPSATSTRACSIGGPATSKRWAASGRPSTPTTASCWTTATSTRWSSGPPTTGTACRWSTPAPPARDVYVEKPLANSIDECQVMSTAARHYGRVVQCGQWQRSGPHWTEAVAFVHSGTLGRIRSVRAWAYMNWLPPGARRARQRAAGGRRTTTGGSVPHRSGRSTRTGSISISGGSGTTRAG